MYGVVLGLCIEEFFAVGWVTLFLLGETIPRPQIKNISLLQEYEVGIIRNGLGLMDGTRPYVWYSTRRTVLSQFVH